MDPFEYDLVYCSFGEDVNLRGFDFLGFDVGYYESECLHFSVLLNEVVCGTAVELVELSKVLNENLRVSSESVAEEILRSRGALLRAGVDLESGGEVMGVIAVYGARRA